MKQIPFFVCLSIFYSPLFSQNKTADIYLIREIGTFLQNRDGVEKYGRKPEIEYLMLEVDSIGKISDIHLLSDEKQRDFTYNILCELKPEHLSRLSFEKWKGKLLVLPIISRSEYGESNYTNKFGITLFFMREEKNTVFLYPLYYQIPEYFDRNFLNKSQGTYDIKK